MSAAEQLVLPFDFRDIHNASTSDVHGPETAILALSKATEYVDPSIYPYGLEDIHYISECERSDVYNVIYAEADAHFRNKEYMQCADLLGRVLKDLDHAARLNQVIEFDIRVIMEHCYHLTTRKTGAKAVADVIVLSTEVHDNLIEPVIVPQIAS